MIKIISYVDIAFFYRKANILRWWSNILRIFNGNKGLCHCCRFNWFGWKLALLHTAFEPLWYQNLCCVLVEDSRGCPIYEHTAVRVQIFFVDWQLAPVGLLSDLVTVDTDWRRLNLLTDSRRRSPETQRQFWNWLRQLPYSTQVVNCLQTVHCWLHLMGQRWQNSCILSNHLMTTPWARNAAYEISRNSPIRTASTLWCRHCRLYL